MKRTMRIVLLIAAATCLLTAGDGAPVPMNNLATGKVGMAAVPFNWQDTEENWLAIFEKAREAGAQLLGGGNMQWTEEIEPSPGVFDWSSLDRFFAVMEKHGFDFEFACDMCGAFFHEKIHAPGDIQFKSFIDPAYLKRYKAMMTSFLDHFSKRTDYVVIHAEGAYSYFNAHPGQLEDYCRFLSEVRAHVQQHSPHIKVAVNTDPHNADALLERIGREVDYMAYDFMRIKGHVDRPTDLEPMVRRLLRLADGKKIAIQNGGWSTANVENSSNEQQVEFVREFYRVLRAYRDRIEYACFYTLFDDDLEVTGPIYRAMFPEFPNDALEAMIESNGRFGLFTHDGNPKPAWHELKKQIAAYYRGIPEENAVRE